MPYVMVPVPEEHVEDVMQFMLKALARANQAQWDQDAVTRVFAEVDELTKTLLAHLARSVTAEKQVFEGDAAAAVQLSLRETSAIVREVNERAREENRPPLVFRRPFAESLPNGRTIEKFIFTMEPELAPLVAEAERADLGADLSARAAEAERADLGADLSARAAE